MKHRLFGVWALLALAVAPAQAQNAFSFVAIGDVPYGPRDVVYPKYSSLIGAINKMAPEFTMHVGDIKSGSTVCSDEEFENQLAFLNSFSSALIYTPGDNEWTDCHRRNNGGFDPLERLAKLRAIFFKDARSLGRMPIPIERQPDVMADHRLYVENVRFVKERVMFVTVHIVGSNNNFEARDAKAVEEFMARDKANIAWIKSAFQKAGESGASALVLAIQANPFEVGNESVQFPPHSGYSASLGETFLPLAMTFRKPVLIINGDTHTFRIDHPFKDAKRKPVTSITRLEVFGAEHMHAVRVTVDPAKGPDIWSFQPIYNPADQQAEVGAR
jgi:hypothetical protein